MRIHREANNEKFSGFFTGFLEGILASKEIEDGELEPLLETCSQMLAAMGDEDAYDIIEDFKADLLEYDQLADIVKFRQDYLKINCTKTELNRFMGLCSGIACDGKITLGEAQGVVSFSSSYPVIVDDPVARTIVACCIDALEDAHINDSESDDICFAISRLVGDCYAETGIAPLEAIPVLEEANITDISELSGVVVVLTGNFETKPRKVLADRLLDFEITSKKAPCQKTDYVIIANASSRDWKYTHKGAKIVKALELREKAGKPQFIFESSIMRLIETPL